MYGQTELSGLLHSAGVVALLTDPSYIWFDTVQPNKGPKVKAINYYLVSPVGPEDWIDHRFSVNCRAPSELEARTMARAVRDAVNRQSSGSVFFVVSVLPVIPPSDRAGDNYNAPLDIRAMGRDV